MSLKDVMAVSGADGGTLSPRFDSIRNSLVAKTGTVDPAVTLAGMLSTNQGEVYFGVFMDTESPADWNNARDQVRDKVMDLMQQFGGRRVFDYTAQSFLPFDSSSNVSFEERQILTALP
jgi:D-alanyl-D-alanine carboxypeptidase/D-alanyl-D-alanine-endopeptidase (penicillin-binding protein 4)